MAETITPAQLDSMLAIQNALNQVWGVPVNNRPDPVWARLRGLLLLVLFASAC